MWGNVMVLEVGLKGGDKSGCGYGGTSDGGTGVSPEYSRQDTATSRT